jgi:acyl dehydratase
VHARFLACGAGPVISAFPSFLRKAGISLPLAARGTGFDSTIGDGAPRVIYFEDLEVGKESYFGSTQVTREEVLEFARKYDPQPFHLSDEAAAKTYFGRLSASGWHTCAMVMGVIARKVVEEKQAGLGAPGIDELRWLKPVYPGDTLHVHGTIVEKTPSRSKPEIGSFRTKTTVTNQDGVPVLTFTSIVLMRRRPGEG